jgi:hypothetical protein
MSRIFLIRAAQLWVLALVIGSFLPGGAKTALGTHSQHRLYHVLAFGSTAYLLTLIARDARQRVYALVFVIALGMLIEYSQHYIFCCRFEWWDFRDDVFGVMAAALLSQWCALRHKLVRRPRSA